MAAILIPAPETCRPSERFAPPRPRFTVIEGGRSAAHQAVVYRRRRVVAALVMLALAIGVLAVARAGLQAITPHTPTGATVSAPAPAGWHPVVVQSGDSLWSIARRVQPNGDVRALVDRLSAEHGPAPLQPGDVISVP